MYREISCREPEILCSPLDTIVNISSGIQEARKAISDTIDISDFFEAASTLHGFRILCTGVEVSAS